MNAGEKPAGSETTAARSAPPGPLVAPGASICALFAAGVIEHGNHLALLCGSRQISYRELDEAATRIGLRLQRAGLRKGEIVGLVAQRSIESIAAIVGILKAGGAYLPLDISYPRELLRFICNDSRPALTLVQRTLLENAGMRRFWSGKTLCLESDCRLSEAVEGDELASAGEPPNGGADPAEADIAPIERSIGAEDLAYVMYTSGSTGRPKGVMIPHRAVARLVFDCDFASLGPDEVLLHLAPLSFDASTFEIWGALLNGGRLAIVPAPHPSLDEIAEAIHVHKVTTLWLTAGLFNLMVERRLSGLKTLRQLIAGGDVLSPPHIARALEALPSCRIVNGYGPTENTTFTCCYTIPRDRPCTESIPIGAPIRGTVVHVLDGEMQPVPDGEEGELYAGGAGVALGYLNQPTLTAERFVADPFDSRLGARLYRTGDRVRRRPDGNIEFLGRVDRQIKINGKRVELDAIEACLRRAKAVRDVAVVSRVGDAGRRSVVAFVTAAEGCVLVPAELRTFLRSELPDFMIPAEISLLDALPLSPIGKVDRARLSDAHSLAAPATAPRTIEAANRTQAALQQIWSRLLRVDSVGVDDNFFDVGGTSLLLIEAHAEIAEVFGIPISVVELFEHATIRELAARIDGMTAGRQALFAADERARRRWAALARAHSMAGRKGAA